MLNFKRTLTLSLLMATGFVLSASSAQAANRFAAVTIENPLNHPVTFMHKTKNSSWRSVTLGPGQHRTLRHMYGRLDEDRSPTLYIKFDQDLSANDYWSSGVVDRYAVRDEASRGKRYRFYLDGPTGRFMHLTSVN